MATGSEVTTVWIGFMDIVPVIGTVKEAVELVLALYEGNKTEVKEKEKAVENFVQLSFKKKLTCPDKSANVEAAAPEFSEFKSVSEATKENFVDYMAKYCKKEPKITSSEQKGSERKVEAIKKDMLERIQVIKPEFQADLKEQLTRSTRGEHVFNNDILKFHSKVLKKFIEMKYIYNLRGYDQNVMDKLGKNTLPTDTAREIQDNMVAHFDVSEFYVNANVVMYGEYSRALHGAMLDVLNHINPDDVKEVVKEKVNFVIDNMNNLEIYVDHLAKVKWIDNKQDRRRRFWDVKGKVVNMYSRDRGLNWCFDILHEVEPLFNPRQ